MKDTRYKQFITPGQRRALAAAVKAAGGVHSLQIAQWLGLSQPTVRALLRSHGYKLPGKGNPLAHLNLPRNRK